MQCGCTSENEFYTVGRNELVVEKFEDCRDCGSTTVQIHILKNEEKDCFCDKIHLPHHKLAYWCGDEEDRKGIIITLLDFKDSINRKAEESFESLWDELSEDELESIPYEFAEKLEKKYLKILSQSLGEE